MTVASPQVNAVTASKNGETPVAPKTNFSQEVRFAVVMYGGVSLAIYINGIAQELLRWVRSTARRSKEEVALLPSRSSSDPASSQNAPQLSGTERVYRKLSYVLSDPTKNSQSVAERLAQAEDKLARDVTINTRFVVDILSGTS